MWRKYLLITIILFSALAYTLPWKSWLEEKLKSELVVRGITKLEFSIDSVGWKEIAFKDIVFGELRLPALSISYTPLELWRGNFSELHTKNITFHKDKLEITLEDMEASVESGKWKIGEIKIVGTPVVLPVLAGKGTVKLEGDKIFVDGDIYSVDIKTKVEFALNYPNLKILEAKLPWNEGTLSAQNISIPLNVNTPIAVTLKVKQISMNSLLAAATNNRASATGVMSGTIPIVIARDGSFAVKKGNLKAEKTGTLVLSPDVIPSDTPQIALLRDVLKDFHYSEFSMGIESADNKQLSMLLSLEGNNPDVYNGRVVKLNVHLTGDVIELITKSVMMLENLK